MRNRNTAWSLYEHTDTESVRVNTEVLYMCVSLFCSHEWLSILWPGSVTHLFSKCFHLGASEAKPLSAVTIWTVRALLGCPPRVPDSKTQTKNTSFRMLFQSTNTWLAWIFFLNLALDLSVSFPLTTKMKLLTHTHQTVVIMQSCFLKAMEAMNLM